MTLVALGARIDDAVVRDLIGHQAAPPHLLEQIERALPFAALGAPVDSAVVVEDIGGEALLAHLFEQPQRLGPVCHLDLGVVLPLQCFTLS